jgi:Flp pilus assembly pilin Flp
MQGRRDRISHTRRLRVGRTRGRNVMTMLINQLRMLAKDESGQDLLEYALLVALIALVAFGAVAAAGSQVNAIFNSIANQLKTT